MSKTTRFTLENFIWFIIIALFVAASTASYFLQDQAVSLRIAGWIIVLAIAALLGIRTSQGARFWSFLKSAKNELMRVVWPTKQETVRMTGIVIAIVIVLALLLWAVDSILLWMMSWFTSIGG